jgi:hypothetical protein
MTRARLLGVGSHAQCSDGAPVTCARHVRTCVPHGLWCGCHEVRGYLSAKRKLGRGKPPSGNHIERLSIALKFLRQSNVQATRLNSPRVRLSGISAAECVRASTGARTKVIVAKRDNRQGEQEMANSSIARLTTLILWAIAWAVAMIASAILLKGSPVKDWIQAALFIGAMSFWVWQSQRTSNRQ